MNLGQNNMRGTVLVSVVAVKVRLPSEIKELTGIFDKFLIVLITVGV